MKIITGLGNPGEEYKDTLHNTGFKVIDKLSSMLNIPLAHNIKMSAGAGKGKIENESILLLKPFTFMNESGRAVKQALDYYRIAVSDLIVICDDLDLEIGRIRIREKGSSAGHKGINSII
jgi:peptidyl-tRNA hydrolase, PTH1 family